jgi:peroxiredoxin
MLRPGDAVPDVTLTTADGAPIRLREFLGRPLVVQCLRYYG